MAALPKSGQQPSPERVFSTIQAYHNAFVLRAGIELDVFTAIAQGSHTVAEIAQTTDSAERGIRILCDALTVMGFLEKTGNRYGLIPDSAVFLDKRSPAYMGKAFQFLMGAEQMDNFVNLTESFRNGGRKSEHQSGEPEAEMWVDFARGMVPLMMPAAQAIAQHLQPAAAAKDSARAKIKQVVIDKLGAEKGRAAAEVLEAQSLDALEMAMAVEEAFGIEVPQKILQADSTFKVLDIAAGHGIFGIMVAKQCPNAHIHALDWANVLEVARENAQAHGVAGRHHLLPGSAFDVDCGKDYDAVLLTNFLHHFDVSTCEALLKKLWKTMNPGAQLVILEFVPNADRVSPSPAAMFSVTMLSNTPAGDAYTFAELASMCVNAGFKGARLIPLEASPEALVVAEKP